MEDDPLLMRDSWVNTFYAKAMFAMKIFFRS